MRGCRAVPRCGACVRAILFVRALHKSKEQRHRMPEAHEPPSRLKPASEARVEDVGRVYLELLPSVPDDAQRQPGRREYQRDPVQPIAVH